jgi:hypothetical protein
MVAQDRAGLMRGDLWKAFSQGGANWGKQVCGPKAGAGEAEDPACGL